MRTPWSRRKPNPQGEMRLIGHLYELRDRLGVSILAILITTIFGYIWFETALFGLPSLGEMLKAPYCQLPPGSRAVITADPNSCTLLGTGPFDQFMLRLKVGGTAGIVLACPIWLYQAWRFVTPALKTTERRYAFAFSTVAALLFTAGAILAYMVVAQGLGFLLTIGSEIQTTALTGASYFSFVIALLIIFGVSFELPLVVVALNLAGIVSYESLRKSRRAITMGLFVFAAVATPGQDPISMCALALALVLLFELATQVARFTDRRRGRRDEALLDDLDSPSDIDVTPSRLP